MFALICKLHMQTMLGAFSQQLLAIRRNTGIKKMYIGGQNEDWEIPKVDLPKVSSRQRKNAVPPLDPLQAVLSFACCCARMM